MFEDLDSLRDMLLGNISLENMLLRDMLQEREAGTHFSDCLSFVTCPFLRKSSVAGTLFCLHSVLREFSRF